MIKKYNSVYGLKGFQLKNIIEQYNEKYPEQSIKGYKSKTINKLDKIISKFRIDISKYNVVKTNPYQPQNIYKKAGIKQYDESQQNQFLEELNENDKYNNPLEALKPYTNKEGKIEYIKLQKHQEAFITHFIYSNLRGSIMFHGVGSGKTLTAVVSSYYYLKVYPKNKVIVISPSALLYNFVQGMVQYGLDINDNRYSFHTYDKYHRNPKIAKDALLIIDEAHNFRTEIKYNEVKDPTNPDKIDLIAVKNTRGDRIMKYGSGQAHKVLLLTGTAFVNIIYDIENLLAMIDNRKPLETEPYKDILSKLATMKDYFNYRISYYKTSNEGGFFPQRNELIYPIYMTEEQEKAYNKIKSEGRPDIIRESAEGANAFYSAEKYASNMIDKLDNPKLQHIIKLVKEKSKEKIIIYSGLFDSGIEMLGKALKNNNIKFTRISGRENTNQKEDAKQYFNYYNFNDDNFFDINNVPTFHHKYINKEYRVLLITRAGAEGVDTINCENIIILDGQWNDALSEQIIARAIRFKSHFGLPLNRRKVNVFRPLFVFNHSKDIIDDINKGNFNFIQYKEQLLENIREQTKLMKGKDKRHNPTIKELKKMKLDGKAYIPDLTQYTHTKGVWGRKGQTIQTSPDGWDKYNILPDEKDRKEWRMHMFYKWVTASKGKFKKQDLNTASIDLYLYILAKAKQQNIDAFIEMFNNPILLFEKYQSKIMNKFKGMKYTEKQKIDILKTAKEDELKEIIKYDISLAKFETNKSRNKKNQLQQFYTNGLLAMSALEFSSLPKNKDKKINILEPSAGVGDLILPVIKLNINGKITLVEYDPDNRKTLNKLVEKTPLLLTLAEQPNFLLFNSSIRYDYIFMNPPFHLRKSEDYNLIRDVWDFDFIKRAFGLLKKGGELIAITSKKFLMDDEFMKWTKMKNKTFEYSVRKNEKFSGIKIDIALMKLIKIDESEDSDLLSFNYYKNQDDKGKAILNIEKELIYDEKEKPISNTTVKALNKSQKEEVFI